MSEGPNLTLPPRDAWAPPPRQRASLLNIALIAGIAAAVGLQVVSLLRTEPAARPAATAGHAAHKSPVSLREVAVKLQLRNLHEAAARAYQEYLAAADLSDEERANLLFETGKLLAKAGKYEEALGQLYRALPIIPPANEDALKRETLACLQRLGKHAEEGYELKDQLRPQGKAGPSAGDREAAQAVAWIGPEKITAADVDDSISKEIEERLAEMPGLPPEKIAELKAQAQKRFSSPQARLAKVQELVAREVLYREGLERKVDGDSRVEKRVEDFRRNAVVEEMVLSAMRDRIKVSESDLKTSYRANPSRYRQKASAKVRVAVLPDEAKAKELIAAAKTEDDFARLAKERSAEESTREKGGLLDQPVVDGEPIPVLGSAPELSAAIFATEAGRPAAAPVKVGNGFAAAFVVERIPERLPPFEELRDRVARDYMQEKEAEVQSALVKELFEKHHASVNAEAFLGPAAAKENDAGKDDAGKKDAGAKPANAPAAAAAPAPAAPATKP